MAWKIAKFQSEFKKGSHGLTRIFFLEKKIWSEPKTERAERKADETEEEST